MLILTRKEGERIFIDENIIIEAYRIGYKTVALGITAPQKMLVLREELKGDRRNEGIYIKK